MADKLNHRHVEHSHYPDHTGTAVPHLRQLHRGNYKTSSNSIAAFDENGQQVGVVFETASPYDTPRLVAELVGWLNAARSGGENYIHC